MEESNNILSTKILPLLISLSLLFFTAFFNYISSLYSSVDLFKLDVTGKNKTKNKRVKKLFFVLKNNYLLFVVICFFQVIISFFLSIMLNDFLGEFFEYHVYLNFSLFGIAICIAFLTEVMVRYLADRTKHLVLNNFFLGI